MESSATAGVMAARERKAAAQSNSFMGERPVDDELGLIVGDDKSRWYEWAGR